MALSLEEKNKVSELKQKGYSNTQIMGHIASTRRGMTSAISKEIGEMPDKEVQKELSYGQSPAPTLQNRLANIGSTAASDIKGAIQGTGEFEGQSAIRRGTEAVATASSVPIQAAVEFAPEPVRNVVGKVAETVGKGFNKVVDWLSERNIVKDAAGYQVTNPDGTTKYIKNDLGLLEEALGTASAAGEIAGNILAAEGAVKSGEFGRQVVNKTSQTVSNTFDGALRSADDTFRSGIETAQRAKNVLSSKITGRNIDPQFQTSAERIATPKFLEGTTERVDNPLKLYDEYLQQSKRAINDTKIDPAISQVGSEIGDSFKDVVQQRRDVGKVLSSELEKVKSVQTNVLPVIDTFVSDLRENGLIYDRVTRSIKPVTSQVKIGNADQKLLQNYAQELQVLGSKPTVADIDAFISRVNDDLKIYKSTNNIVGTTNAERLIIKSLSDLRTELTKSAGKLYTEARSAYSDLSRFIEEGERYLGKITQSGDFAKDASLAKSSVQSILNNGKKDWLIELEALTGKPLLDKSVLALQAMKDAGDFRGNSLLEVLSDGAVPTSKAGIIEKIIDFALSKTGETLVGTPEEQTRRFLNDLLQKQQ